MNRITLEQKFNTRRRESEQDPTSGNNLRHLVSTQKYQIRFLFVILEICHPRMIQQESEFNHDIPKNPVDESVCFTRSTSSNSASSRLKTRWLLSASVASAMNCWIAFDSTSLQPVKSFGLPLQCISLVRFQVVWPRHAFYWCHVKKLSILDFDFWFLNNTNITQTVMLPSSELYCAYCCTKVVALVFYDTLI